MWREIAIHVAAYTGGGGQPGESSKGLQFGYIQNKKGPCICMTLYLFWSR